MNYEQDVYASWDNLPQCRIHIDLGDGGEGCWGRELPDGTYALDNYPLHGEYRWQDVVSSRELRSPDQLVHRRWNTRIHFKFDQPKFDQPKENENQDEARAIRKKIFEALESDDSDPGFWCPGVGYVSFKEALTDEEAEAKVTQLLGAVGIPVTFFEDEDEEE